MKKLITILTIAIVLVGAVFAADNAAITITTCVPEKVPTFKLITVGNTLKSNTSEGSDAVEANGSTAAGSITLADTVGEALAEGTEATVNFAIVQVRPAGGKIKTTKTYSFSVTASDLAHKTLASADNTKFTKKSISTIAKVDNAIAATYATITPGATASIKYSGKNYAPATEDITFATFSVTWNGNDAAVSGDYEATVTLTMTTT